MKICSLRVEWLKVVNTRFVQNMEYDLRRLQLIPLSRERDSSVSSNQFCEKCTKRRLLKIHAFRALKRIFEQSKWLNQRIDQRSQCQSGHGYNENLVWQPFIVDNIVAKGPIFNFTATSPDCNLRDFSVWAKSWTLVPHTIKSRQTKIWLCASAKTSCSLVFYNLI